MRQADAVRTLCAVVGLAVSGMGRSEVVSEELLARLSESIGGLRTMQTAFVQEKTLRVLIRPMEIHGRAYLARPDRFAWHVASPIRYTLLMDGAVIRQWDAESDRETRLALDSSPALQMAAEQMRQWFSGDYSGMRSAYRITQEAADPVVLAFVPAAEHPARDYIERVTVTFTRDERYLALIDIVERGGDRTVIRFHDTTLDADIPDTAWRLRSEGAAE